MSTEITKFPEVTEGTIFRSGINYNDFWQVTRRTNSTLWVRKLAKNTHFSSSHGFYGTESPRANSFISSEIKCRIIKNENPCIRPTYDYAFLWKGNEVDFNQMD